MERDWRLHCAELRGEELPEEQEPFSLAQAALAMPSLWSRHYGDRECSGPELAIPARSAAQPATRRSRPLSAGRDHQRPVLCLCRVSLWLWLGGLGAMLLIWCLIALTCIDFDTSCCPTRSRCPCSGLDCCSILFATFTDLQSAVIGAVAAISRCGWFTGRSS
jgi:leader peptidase (prepilin peptidase)/N-methyltransferase